MAYYESLNTSSTQRATPAWTTARCNRLLRPLVSSLGKLWAAKRRRDVDTQWKQKDDLSKLGSQSDVEVLRSLENEDDSSDDESGGGENEEEDPVWLPPRTNQGTLVIKHKYNRQRRMQETGGGPPCEPNKKRCRPGDIILSTPLLRKTIANDYNSPETPMPSTMAVATKSSTRRARNKARESPEERLQVAYAYLLEATKSPPEQMAPSQHGTGCRSLLSMCLREVPYVIQREQELQRQLDEVHERDISTEIYDMLEELEVAAGAGWPHLRELVRYHAVQLISEAIRENVLDTNTSKALSWMCIRQQGHYGGGDLLSALAPRLARSPNTDDLSAITLEPTAISNESLLRTACNTVSRSFWFQQIAQLLQEGYLRVDQLTGPEYQSTWNEVIGSIGRQSHHAFPAIKLVETFLFQCCSDSETRTDASALGTTADAHLVHGAEWNSALQNTIFSLCTILCVLSNVSPLVANMVTRCMKTIEIDLTHASQATGTGLQICRHRRHREAITTIASSQVILASMNIESEIHYPVNSSFDHFQTPLYLGADEKLTESHAAVLVNLACAVSQSSDRLKSKSGFELVKSLGSRLMSNPMSDEASTGFKWMAKKLALDVTFAYSQATQSLGSQALVRTVEKAVGMRSSERPELANVKEVTSDDLEARVGGYRWEEGICEWIKATPAKGRTLHARIRRFNAPPNDMSSENGKIRTPMHDPTGTNEDQRVFKSPSRFDHGKAASGSVVTSHQPRNGSHASTDVSESSDDELCMSARAFSRKRDLQKRAFRDVTNLPHPGRHSANPLAGQDPSRGTWMCKAQHRRVEAEVWDDELSFGY